MTIEAAFLQSRTPAIAIASTPRHNRARFQTDTKRRACVSKENLDFLVGWCDTGGAHGVANILAAAEGTPASVSNSSKTILIPSDMIDVCENEAGGGRFVFV